MGADSQWAVQDAITTALKADSTLTTKLASGSASILEAVPASPTYALVVVGKAEAKRDDTMSDDGMSQIVHIETYSDSSSMQAAKEIMAAIYDVLHDAALTVTGHTLVLLHFTESLIEIDATDTTRRKGVQQFQVITHP